MNDMSAWTRWIFVGCLLAGMAAIYWFSFGPGKTSVATWRVDGTVEPETTELPLLVTETECASGASATGRIQEPDVDYRADTVVVPIRVEQRSAVPRTAPPIPRPPISCASTSSSATGRCWTAASDRPHHRPRPPGRPGRVCVLIG